MKQQAIVPEELLERIKLNLAAKGIIEQGERHSAVGNEVHIRTDYFDSQPPEEQEHVTTKIRGIIGKEPFDVSIKEHFIKNCQLGHHIIISRRR